MKTVAMMLACALFSFTASALQITWTDNSDNENGFVVERRLFQNVDYNTLVTLAGDSISYSDDTMASGETYCYRVGAFNTAGVSYSGEYCVSVPTAPVKKNKGKAYGKRNK